MLEAELELAVPVLDGEEPDSVWVAVGATDSDEEAATGSLEALDPLELLELFDPESDPTPPVSPVPTLFVQYILDDSSTWGCCCCRSPAYASRMSSKSPEPRLITLRRTCFAARVSDSELREKRAASDGAALATRKRRRGMCTIIV